MRAFEQRRAAFASLISAKAAKKAAAAAERHATAAIGVELPFLNIEGVRLNHEPPIDAALIDNWDGTFTPFVKIKNHGRTHALITSVIINAKIARVIPAEPTYIQINKYFSPVVLESGKDHEYGEYLFRALKAFTAEEIMSLSSRRGKSNVRLRQNYL